jgi:hypothetical protein
VERVSIAFDQKTVDFDLNLQTKRWTPIDATASEVLELGDFPLVAMAGGKRYELYDNETFDEEEL